MPYSEKQKIQHITELQRYLRAIAERRGASTAVIPDGIYGDETAAAVMGFQRENGLPETGDTDTATWNAIAAAYRSSFSSTPARFRAFPSADHICRIGEEGVLVYTIQAMLHNLGRLFDDFNGCEICGTYNTETADSVREFQRRCGLAPTGEADNMTWDMLVKCTSHKF